MFDVRLPSQSIAHFFYDFSISFNRVYLITISFILLKSIKTLAYKCKHNLIKLGIHLGLI